MDRLVALALALALVLAGCGGVTGGDATTVSGETPTAAPTTDGGPTAAASTTPAANGTLAVHFLDVGQASATLVVGPRGETMLVDSGDFTDDGEVVIAYLESLGIERLDYLVTSHADADHVGGHAAVIEHFEREGDGVGAVYDPGVPASTRTYEAYLDAVERYDVTLYETRVGDSIPMAGASVAVLGPPAERLAGGERNENSLVLRLRHGETSVLLPGDAGEKEEEFLVERYGDRLDSTVLLAGHHGSSTSSSSAFLDRVSPRVVVLSSAYDSTYGHPHEEVLARLADREIPTLWTATHGTVVVRSNGSAAVVATQRAAPTDPERIRDGTPVEPGTEGDAAVERRFVVRPDGSDAVAPFPTGSSDGVDTPVAVADGGTGVGDDSGTKTDAPDAPDTTDVDLELVDVTADPPGDDRERLAEESVTLRNAGERPLDLSGWTLRDEAGHVYRFSDGAALDSGATVTVHTGSGTDTESDRYWEAGGPVWNNDGDRVVVANADGDRVLTEAYE